MAQPPSSLTQVNGREKTIETGASTTPSFELHEPGHDPVAFRPSLNWRSRRYGIGMPAPPPDHTRRPVQSPMVEAGSQVNRITCSPAAASAEVLDAAWRSDRMGRKSVVKHRGRLARRRPPPATSHGHPQAASELLTGTGAEPLEGKGRLVVPGRQPKAAEPPRRR